MPGARREERNTPGVIDEFRGSVQVGLFSRKKTAPETDAELVRRIAGGDETALEKFYEAYFPRLYRYIYYRVGRDHHHTEEVVNDTFMEALEKAESYDPGRGSVESWLITLSRNRIRSSNAGVGRAREYEQSWSMLDGELETIFADLENSELPESALANSELASLIGAVMSSLPDQYRKLLEMKYIADLPVRDMAARLEKTEKAVESQLTRARLAFRDAFRVVATDMPAGLA